jgi:hypothetical protein
VRSLRLDSRSGPGARPGGQLIFLVNSVQLILTVPDQDDLPATEQLQRPYFGMHRFQWLGTDSVEFHIGHGDMIRLLRGCGLEVEDLLELRPHPDATTRYPYVTLDWSRQWPCEEVWKARKSRLAVCWQDDWSKWGRPLPGYGPRRVAQLARQHSHVAHRRGTG